MDRHPSWSGFLKLSLVTCPVKLYSTVTSENTIAFHLINPDTNTRINMRPVDSQTGELLERKHLVRGYELEDGRYVRVTDEDLKKIRLQSTRTIEVERFIDFAEIDPVYYGPSYYLVPDGDSGADAYVVICEAMKRRKRAAIGRLVLSYRERLVVINPYKDMMLLTRLRDSREIAPLDVSLPHGKPDPQMVGIAMKIIDQNEGKFEPAEFEDPYEAALRSMIKRREKGAEPLEEEAPEELEKPTNVIDLMSVLKRSLRERPATAPAKGEIGSGKVVHLGTGRRTPRKPKHKPRNSTPSKRRG